MKIKRDKTAGAVKHNLQVSFQALHNLVKLQGLRRDQQPVTGKWLYNFDEVRAAVNKRDGNEPEPPFEPVPVRTSTGWRYYPQGTPKDYTGGTFEYSAVKNARVTIS